MLHLALSRFDGDVCTRRSGIEAGDGQLERRSVSNGLRAVIAGKSDSLSAVARDRPRARTGPSACPAAA